MSENIDELDRYIGRSEHSGWSEYISEQVGQGVFSLFSSDDWLKLARSALSKPRYWQLRCAAALGDSRSSSAIKMLKMLLKSEYSDVCLIAASELAWSGAQIEFFHVNDIERIISKIPCAERDSYSEVFDLLSRAKSSRV